MNYELHAAPATYSDSPGHSIFYRLSRNSITSSHSILSSFYSLHSPSLRVGGGVAVLCFLLCVILFSSCSVKARVRKADKKYEIGEYYDAADLYKRCYSHISPTKEKKLKARVAFRQGECYRILNIPRAANAYKNAIRYKYQDSIVYLRYAQTLHYQGKYKEADANYLIYLQSYPQDYVAQAGHYACGKVGEWRKEPTRYKVSPATEFNAKRSSNFAPAYIGQDADALVFTSNRQESAKAGKKKLKRPSPVTGSQLFNLYSARKNAAGKWEDIGLVEGLYNSEQPESENDSTADKSTASAEMGVCCFTADGRTMFFTCSKPVNGQDLGAKIYTSSRTGGEWGEPQEVKLFADSSVTVGHPSVNAAGDTLYFVSDAPGGYGGKDIYMAERDGDEWVNVQNMGAQINTSGEEMYPCIHPDGTLYFSSDGHPGYGGLDIFKAERDTTVKDSVAWRIYNMGMPFNSSGDDFGITFEGKSQNGFFSSARGQKKGLDAIYRFVLPEMQFSVSGTVTDNRGEPVSDAQLRLVGDDGTNTRLQVHRDGTYKIRIRREARYVMLATARGYLNARDGFSTLGLTDSKTYTQNFTLAPVSRPVTMDNIFYEFGKWELTAESEKGLQALVKLLKDNPNITIELSAHTDMKGDSVFNVNLSEKRAQTVCAWLVENGIEAERLTPVGYGKQKPVTADKALHDKYPFIPQEQVLDEAFILTLAPEQQEICNAVNRRTEFRVLRTTYKLY